MVTDAVGSIRTVASFSAEDKIMDMFKKKCEVHLKEGMREKLVSGVGFGLSYFLLFCAYATIFWAGAKFILHGKTSFADVFQVSNDKTLFSGFKYLPLC